MNASGFGVLVPYGEVPAGTLFLRRSASGLGETVILLKISGGHGDICICGRPPAGEAIQLPCLKPPVPAEWPVIALADFILEVENRIDNVVWKADPDFVKAVVYADPGGGLALKAWVNPVQTELFDLATGAPVDQQAASVGFRRWSIIRRNAAGERFELFRFDL
ncbi:MAG: hypothetical protein WCF85_01210 [Rhodospirillaceae bacterium]